MLLAFSNLTRCQHFYPSWNFFPSRLFHHFIDVMRKNLWMKRRIEVEDKSLLFQPADFTSAKHFFIYRGLQHFMKKAHLGYFLELNSFSLSLFYHIIFYLQFYEMSADNDVEWNEGKKLCAVGLQTLSVFCNWKAFGSGFTR